MENEILQNASEEKPSIQIEVNVKWRPFFSRFTNRKDEKVTFDFRLAKVCNMSRMAQAIQALPKELIGADTAEMAIDHILGNIDQITYVVACGIQNNHKEPSKNLIQFIKNNFDHELLLHCYNISISLMGLDTFVKCIILVRGAAKILNPDLEGTYVISPDGELENDKA